MKLYFILTSVTSVLLIFEALHAMEQGEEIKQLKAFVKHDTIYAQPIGLYEGLHVHDTVVVYRTNNTNIEKVETRNIH